MNININIQSIAQQTNEILYGRRDVFQFNQAEHAGLCSAGPLLVGALLVCNLARESVTASCHARSGEEKPANWEIDQAQEEWVRYWAEKSGFWIPEAEDWLNSKYGPMIAQGAEAKVFGRTGDTHVVKLRTSIYATLGRAFEAIALHNCLFPETIMQVVGFTRDSDGLFRVILTQPYIECMRLAYKNEIDSMLASKGFRDNGDGTGVNYISERLHLEDMHPANVFVEPTTSSPLCIDCIVKFVRK